MRIIRFLLLTAFIVFVAAPAWPAGPLTAEERVVQLAAGRGFDFAGWWGAAAVSKLSADLGANHAYLSEEMRVGIVRDYLEQLGEVRGLERELARLYVDPNVDDPEAAGADLRAQIAARRGGLAELQPLAEAILQEQVAAVLLDEGFAIGGRVWPPVRMRLSPLPTLLVVSPRDEIRQLKTVPLEAGFSVAERAELEGLLAAELDVSAYVTDIGGLGTYPTMVLETTNLNFLVDVIAHEWSHNWFNQFPLGWNYGRTAEVRTINETAAGIIGREIGGEVIRRYYPDLVPLPLPAGELPLPETSTPAPFDFRIEMRETREQVDALLAAGDVPGAEGYMEMRRQFFLANGYQLRVLNQAYFAFHGAYADEVGAAGADPVGPLVNQIRAEAPNLRAFMWELAFVTEFEDLVEIGEQ